MTTNNFDRFVPLEGTFNFRDLGGYRNADGQLLKTGVLYRSDELQHLSSDDLIHIRDGLRLSTVIDLRSVEELSADGVGPIGRIGIAHHNVPFSSTQQEGHERRLNASNMGEYYLDTINRPWFGIALKQAVDMIADPCNHPLLFHCTAGKDRTGLLSGVILGLLGVSRNDIVYDYALSQALGGRLLQRISADPKRAPLSSNFPEWIHGALPESMATVLDNIDAEHGSVEGYVRAQAVDDDTITLLRNSLLE